MATGRVPTTANSPLTAKGDLFGYSTTQARVAVGNNGETLVADSSTSTGLRYSPAPAFGNPVLNSAFQVWQRGTSVTGAGGGAYTADRWFLYAGGQATVSRQATGDTTNLPNIQYCARVQRNNASSDTTGIPFAQSFETINSIAYAGKTVTLSFYARKGANFSAASDQIGVTLATGTGTDQNYLSTGYTGEATPISQAVTLTSTWQRFTYSATLASTATELAIRFFFGPSGTAGAADYFEVTGVQIDVGSVALPFRTYAGTIQGELAACQRYYQRYTAATAFYRYAIGQAVSATQAGYVIPLKVTMRTTPTFSASANSWSNVEGTSDRGTNAPTLSTDGNSPDSCFLNSVIASANAGYALQLRSRSDTTTFLDFSAEL